MFDLMPFRSRRRRGEPAEGDFDGEWSNLFDSFFDLKNTEFRTDIKEKEEEYVVEAELPGLDRDDIVIEVDDENKHLNISVDKEEVVEDEGENYIRKERRSGNYQRSFRLNNVKTDEIEAEYNNGLLTVILPKEEPGKKQRRVIDIN
ncbi:Hsp20/alpha crystallin family protein [Fuchsiella alkaliacetigena]|uniref:Hsp20/alpha crystallin family protein n=1 Tax=Fuchsiella alkaliacetigena TaxID=957042 RepID=UPI00200AB9D3|nr:Hsp20 family protein [Fuchsiella alkaliacetigena]MCK8825582.1 Hsp20 family protein [Fuchsiella alkaliacetigena]